MIPHQSACEVPRPCLCGQPGLVGNPSTMPQQVPGRRRQASVNQRSRRSLSQQIHRVVRALPQHGWPRRDGDQHQRVTDVMGQYEPSSSGRQPQPEQPFQRLTTALFESGQKPTADPAVHSRGPDRQRRRQNPRDGAHRGAAEFSQTGGTHRTARVAASRATCAKQELGARVVESDKILHTDSDGTQAPRFPVEPTSVENFCTTPRAVNNLLRRISDRRDPFGAARPTEHVDELPGHSIVGENDGSR